jgi:hypothetical protein
MAIVAGRNTNHNQNIRAGVANCCDTNTTVSLDVMASCNLHRQRNCSNVIVFVMRTWGRII